MITARKKSKIYQTPKGSVFAKSLEDAALKQGVPVDSVYVLRNGFTGIPPRVAQYY